MIFGEICDPCAYYYYKLFSSRAPHKGNEYDSMTKQRWNFIIKTSKGWNEKSFPRDTLNWVRTYLPWVIQLKHLWRLSDGLYNSEVSSHCCNPVINLQAVHQVCVPTDGRQGLLLCDFNEKYMHWEIFFWGSLSLFLPEDNEDRYSYLERKTRNLLDPYLIPNKNQFHMDKMDMSNAEL